MSEIKDYYQLDSEESEILDAYYQGKLNESPVPETMITAAKQTLKKNGNINIRISENDLEAIKLRENFDYTEWQRYLWKDKTVNEIFHAAKSYDENINS